eukprot:GHVU01115929.1.p1 GENE.GHVU01115929.1~~GHVU01115929.1.p1  ORF type:complete len:345 (-),score=44.41 GHVU01115929.1:178-1212(-)
MGIMNITEYTCNAHVGLHLQCFSSRDPAVRAAVTHDGLRYLQSRYQGINARETQTEAAATKAIQAYLNRQAMDQYGEARTKVTTSRGRGIWGEMRTTLQKCNGYVLDSWEAGLPSPTPNFYLKRPPPPEGNPLLAAATTRAPTPAATPPSGPVTSHNLPLGLIEVEPAKVTSTLNAFSSGTIRREWAMQTSHGAGAAYYGAPAQRWMGPKTPLTAPQYRTAMHGRLNCLPTNAWKAVINKGKRGNGGTPSAKCRHCSQEESAAHVLQNCAHNHTMIIERHSWVLKAIQARLEKKRPHSCFLTEKRTPWFEAEDLRPDINIVDPLKRTIDVVEVADTRGESEAKV